MDQRLNKVSLLWGLPGIILQWVGFAVGQVAEVEADLGLALVALAMQLTGTIALIVGLAFYAKAKGRNPAWGLLGLLTILGIIALALLKDHRPDDAVEG